MAKRVRGTGIPQDQAHPGQELPRLRNYTGYQCPGCPLHGTCDQSPPPGGPWEVIESDPERHLTCKVHPTVQMVPVRVRRIKRDHRPPPPPKHERQAEWNVLLDANALIEGAKGTFPGMIQLVLEPPPGFHYYTTDAVAAECPHLRNVDRAIVFSHITVLPAPTEIDPRITETRGTGITPPSPADAGLFQLALSDPRFHIIVSHDRFHRRTGLPRTLGIDDRVRVYGVSDFVRYAKRHR